MIVHQNIFFNKIFIRNRKINLTNTSLTGTHSLFQSGWVVGGTYVVHIVQYSVLRHSTLYLHAGSLNIGGELSASVLFSAYIPKSSLEMRDYCDNAIVCSTYLPHINNTTFNLLGIYTSHIHSIGCFESLEKVKGIISMNRNTDSLQSMRRFVNNNFALYATS